jgi:uncharacterized protein YqfB (UPF0267 family)
MGFKFDVNDCTYFFSDDKMSTDQTILSRQTSNFHLNQKNIIEVFCLHPDLIFLFLQFINLRPSAPL